MRLIMLALLSLIHFACGETLIEEMAQDDPGMNDPAMDDPAMDDPAMDDPAMDDPAVVDMTLGETKIVVWNVLAALEESLEDRLSDFADFAKNTDADVIVLVEMTGETSVKSFVDQLDWPQAHYVVSDFSELSTFVFFSLEAAVISKVEIEKVIEYDSSVDGAHVVRDKSGEPILDVEEIELTSDGIPDFGDPLSEFDRGTLRVDLANGLSIFPVHLKSDGLSSCSGPQDALGVIRESDFELSEVLEAQLEQAFTRGFSEATAERVSNAVKRERVMAAVARVAEEAIDEGRTAMIAGDFNTNYEVGKKGDLPEDCTLLDYSCEKSPFPASACPDGDGYDDTFAILEQGFAADTKWQILSSGLGRTFDDDAFADLAIDHIAVPIESVSQFSEAERIDDFFGSDHNPIAVTFGN